MREIEANPESFAFKRVVIPGTYLVATATLDYSDAKLPFGVGILADNPAELFFEENGPRLETLDPERKVWQLRQANVTGTILFPTDNILKYFDYSAPLTRERVIEMKKPALLVDSINDEQSSVADIGEINPVTGQPDQYWGQVVEFEGYALGVNVPLKEVANAIAQTEIPINVNLLAIGIADSPMLGSQLAIIGLNNDFVNEGERTIEGRFTFEVAITETLESLTELQGSNTAYFLLNKEALPETPVPGVPGFP